MRLWCKLAEAHVATEVCMFLWVLIGMAASECLNVPGMACVSGGTFERGTSEAHRCEQGENRGAKTTFGPPIGVVVDTFYMDLTEVTIEAYGACVAQKKCPKDGPRYNDFSRPRQPVTAVSWFNAEIFCKAQGKRLPTEVEWERAARGDGQDGASVDAEVPSCPTVIVMDPKRGRSCGTPKKGSQPEKGRVLEVMGTPPGPYGLYEMRGNAEEWVADWFAADLAACGAACAGANPQGPCAGKPDCPAHPKKMVKGGSWYWPGSHARAWHRRPWQPSNRPPHHFGFRCAASLAQGAALAAAAPLPTTTPTTTPTATPTTTPTTTPPTPTPTP
jgi:formylglycine-generating enzyme required for sulfatase activity